jgi:hypothetical protein
MKSPTLTTFLALNTYEVEYWANILWCEQCKLDNSKQNRNKNDSLFTEDDWWAVKASKGNGGRDVWIMNKKNYKQIISQIPTKDEYVIQRFENNLVFY